MEYLFIEQDPGARGYNRFCHEMSFHLKSGRNMELFEFLEETIGKRGKAWRLREPSNFNLFHRSPAVVRFTKKSDAMHFKLSWQEDPAPHDELKSWIQKLNANSTFGATRRGATTAVAPSWTYTPLSQATPGIFPASGKSNMTLHAAKSRLQSHSRTSRRYSMNPCDEIVILDYESHGLAWYDKWIRDLPITDWSHYEQALDAEIRNED